jgi:hypothetical protein
MGVRRRDSVFRSGILGTVRFSTSDFAQAPAYYCAIRSNITRRGKVVVHDKLRVYWSLSEFHEGSRRDAISTTGLAPPGTIPSGI